MIVWNNRKSFSDRKTIHSFKRLKSSVRPKLVRKIRSILNTGVSFVKTNTDLVSIAKSDVRAISVSRKLGRISNTVRIFSILGGNMSDTPKNVVAVSPA